MSDLNTSGGIMTSTSDNTSPNEPQTQPQNTNNNNNNNSNKQQPPPQGERYTLPPEAELRLEIPTNLSVTIMLIEGSAEIFGAELALSRPYVISGTKIAIFTWHGCKVDVDDSSASKESGGGGGVGSSAYIYMSEETDANIAYVNTHAQLEAMRDEALQKISEAEHQHQQQQQQPSTTSSSIEGPRVLLCGPSDCGKSSLARTLLSYAAKLGRCPLLIDIDTSQNMLSVPGTLSASPITSNSISVSSAAATSTSIIGNNTTPLVLWYGSTDITTNPDLYKAQLTKLGKCVDERFQHDADSRSSGFIVNTSGKVEDDVGYSLLLHAAEALRCNVILVLGHDRLYSMLNTHYTKRQAREDQEQAAAAAAATDGDEQQGDTNNNNDANKKKSWVKPKVIKLRRSGGVVSRDITFRRMSRSQCIKRYFHGDVITPSSTSATSTTTTTTQDTLLAAHQTASSDPSATTTATSLLSSSISPIVNQYTPFLLEIPFANLTLHKLSSVSLSASMLPVSAKQSTDPVQLIPINDLSPSLKHSILAVCHPGAVERWNMSGEAADLYLGGVAGFVAVEKVDVGRDMVSLLSPCSGTLPSFHLLVGDITWME